jgi:hypothetical protein
MPMAAPPASLAPFDAAIITPPRPPPHDGHAGARQGVRHLVRGEAFLGAAVARTDDADRLPAAPGADCLAPSCASSSRTRGDGARLA